MSARCVGDTQVKCFLGVDKAAFIFWVFIRVVVARGACEDLKYPKIEDPDARYAIHSPVSSSLKSQVELA